MTTSTRVKTEDLARLARRVWYAPWPKAGRKNANGEKWASFEDMGYASRSTDFPMRQDEWVEAGPYEISINYPKWDIPGYIKVRLRVYTFGGPGCWEFTSKEIDQIVALVKLWTNGSILPVRRAGYSKQVIEYAVRYGLLIERAKSKNVTPRLYTAEGIAFSNVPGFGNLPIEAVWRLVEPMLAGKESIGYTIVYHKGWQHLNIFPQPRPDEFRAKTTSEDWKRILARDLETATSILLRLSGHHYINFQMAGSIWRIEREPVENRLS